VSKDVCVWERREYEEIEGWIIDRGGEPVAFWMGEKILVLFILCSRLVNQPESFP
jgi:hypothetical protein